MEINYLAHHGILGMHWGVRRYQNEDGTLTPLGKRHEAQMERRDAKWAKKNYDKITKSAMRSVKGELKAYQKELIRLPDAFKTNGKLSANVVNAYNQKMAELMTRAASSMRAPSGREVKFVAKRGELGVHMALADAGYDMSAVKRGVWASGKIAYKKENVNMA